MFDPPGEIEFFEGTRDALAGRIVLLLTQWPARMAVADRIVRRAGRRLTSGPYCTGA